MAVGGAGDGAGAFCKVDGRVLWGCCLLRPLGVLLEVLVWNDPPVFRYLGFMLV